MLTGLKINLDGEKDKPDVKSNEEWKQDIKSNNGSNKEHKQDTKPNIKLNKERKHNMTKITYQEEKIALILGTTAVFTVWWMFK